MYFDQQVARINARLKTTTVRNFDGGWNVVDSDLNLAPRFSKILDNMFRGEGGFNQVRYGYRAFAAGDTGTITDNGNVSRTVTTTIGSNIVNINDVGHSLLTGDHVEMDSFSAAIGGIPSTDFDTRFEITWIDVDNYTIRTASNATGNAAAARTFDQVFNTHLIAGFIVNQWYYKNHIIAVDTAGEVFKVDGTGTVTKIWSDTFARALVGAPLSWSPMTFASAAVFKGDLLIANGIDKPLLVNLDNTPEVTYLVDIPSGANTNVPVGRYILAMPEFVVIAGDPLNPDRIHISNQGSSGTWQGDLPPNNGTNIDIGQHTPSFNQEIRSIARYRSFLLVIFDDSIIPVTLGVFDSVPNHIPTINDAIENHGTVSHRSVVSLGNDLLMADHIGIPSIAQATLTNTLRPNRVSELIDPELQGNILQLSVGVAEDNIFALFNPRDRQYMLFVPKHETDATLTVPYNTMESQAVGSGTVRFYLDVPHRFDVGDRFTLAGATALDGITTGQLNITHTVTAVLDVNVFEVQTAGAATNGNVMGGGGSGVISYIQEETTGYIYNTFDSLKVKAWSRFRGMNWRCGCVSQLGRVFFSTTRRFYVYGAREDPVSGDRFNEFDTTWANSTAYAVGHRAYDSVFGRTYRCLVAHTSVGAGTFEAARIADSSLWEDYRGDEINFTWELPWADFDKRMILKQNQFIGLDTKGSAVFNVSMFVDNLYDDGVGNLTPILSMDFIGGSVRGFGGQQTLFGSAALTNEERPWPWPARHKIAKLRFSGAVNEPLSIIAISLAYQDGGIYR